MKRMCLSLAAGLLSLCIYLFVPGKTALAYSDVDTERSGSLELYFGTEWEGFPGVEFRLYRVADMTADAKFALTGAYEAYPVSLENLDSSGFRSLALTLYAYTARDEIRPVRTAMTGEEGWLKAENLETGLYLAEGDPFVWGGLQYTPEPFLVSLPGTDESGSRWEYEISAVCKYETVPSSPEEEQTVSRKVLKVWKDENEESRRPQEVIVQLLRNGAVADTVILNKENNWSYTWTGLDGGSRWQMTEYDVPDDYTVSISQEGITFVVTNTFCTRKPSDTQPGQNTSGSAHNTAGNGGSGQSRLPQTGVLWWPVPLLAGSGLILFGFGWRQRTAERKKQADTERCV